jgi:type IV pilus assembly protein PilX
MNSKRSARARSRSQRGVVLFVALIVLIVMTLAGLALLRQMGVGTSIAGNLAFKENATFVADRGAEVAMQYILPPFPLPPTDTSADSAPNGYWSSWVDGFDPTTLPWGAGKSLAMADDPIIRDIAQTGNTADVFIQRLCATAGMNSLDPAQRCSETLQDSPLRSHGNPGSLAPLPSTTPFPFYRVTTRVLGPRNTVSYTQVLMQ